MHKLAERIRHVSPLKHKVLGRYKNNSHRYNSHSKSYPIRTLYSTFSKVKKRPAQSVGVLLGIGVLSSILVWFRFIR